MPSKIVTAALAALTLALAASPSSAQVASLGQAKPSTASQPSARSTDLVKRLLKASNVDKMYAAMLDQMIATLIQTPEIKRLSADEQATVKRIVTEVMVQDFMPRLIDKMIPVYAETFSEAELEAVVTFYESPPGRAAIEKTPSVMTRSLAFATEMTPQVQTEIFRRLCDEFGCEGAKPKASPS